MSAGEPLVSMVPGLVVAGKFRIEREIGSGGMGVVVEATHLSLGQRVAIKVLKPSARESLDGVARFSREAQAAAAIRSEHGVRIMDFGTLDDGVPYLVMELLEGRDLRSWLRENRKMPIARAVDTILQACEVVSEAHARGIVHRDLKPANLFLATRPDGSPILKVLDFGIAKLMPRDGVDPAFGLTDASSALGTANYMAPEQLRDASDVDGRVDVWALGLTLFELLSGEHAFAGSSATATAAAIVADPPRALRAVAPDVPEELERIVMRCLAKKSERRTASIAELAALLQPFASPAGAIAAERARNVAREWPSANQLREEIDSKEEDATGTAAPPTMETVAEKKPARPQAAVWLSAGALVVALATFIVSAARTPIAVSPPLQTSRAPAATEAETPPPPPPLPRTATARAPPPPETAPAATSPPPRATDPKPSVAPTRASASAAASVTPRPVVDPVVDPRIEHRE